MTVNFTVMGKPEPQGSARAFMLKGGRYPIVTSTNKNLKYFRQQVALVAMDVMKGDMPVERKTPVRMTVHFILSRPASKSKKAYPTVKPDCDKLCRAIGDALTGICFSDDSQITELHAFKEYGAPERTIVEVSEIRQDF